MRLHRQSGIYREHIRLSRTYRRHAILCSSGADRRTRYCKNVHSTSMQGDMKFIDVLKQMGCAVTEEREGICVTGPKDGVYSGVDIDMNDFQTRP